MIDVVNQVYPEFSNQIGLVAVNVYDQRNENLIRRANIYDILTQVFVNCQGKAQAVPGDGGA